MLFLAETSRAGMSEIQEVGEGTRTELTETGHFFARILLCLTA